MSGQNTKDYIQLLEDRVKGCNEVITDQQQKIEKLRKEVERLQLAHQVTQNLWSETLEENNELKEQVRELKELNDEVQKVWNEDEEIKWKTPIAWYRVLRISDKLLTK